MSTGVRLTPSQRGEIVTAFEEAQTDEERQRIAKSNGVVPATVRKWIRYPRFAQSVPRPKSKRAKAKAKAKAEARKRRKIVSKFQAAKAKIGRPRKARNATASASNSHDGIYYLRQILKLARASAGSDTGVNDFDIIGAYAIQGLASLERVTQGE